MTLTLVLGHKSALGIPEVIQQTSRSRNDQVLPFSEFVGKLLPIYITRSDSELLRQFFVIHVPFPHIKVL